MSEINPRRSHVSRFGRWLAELILVFIGVYAAFWLNNYQQHQQDAKRRDEILEYLDQLLNVGIQDAKTQEAKEDRQLAEFRRALAAGEMPALRPFTFTTDYSATDTAALLQSGGVELLDVKTLTTLRELESVVRWGLNRLEHYQS